MPESRIKKRKPCGKNKDDLSIFGQPKNKDDLPIFGQPNNKDDLSIFGQPKNKDDLSIFSQPKNKDDLSIFGQTKNKNGKTNLLNYLCICTWCDFKEHIFILIIYIDSR